MRTHTTPAKSKVGTTATLTPESCASAWSAVTGRQRRPQNRGRIREVGL